MTAGPTFTAAPRRKSPSVDARADLRTELFERVARGEVTLVEAVRLMRKIAKKTQRDFAAMVGVAPRVLMDLERGVGNPTLETLSRILAPFGLEVGVRRKASQALLLVPPRYRVVTAEGARLGEAEIWREAMAIARHHAKTTGRESHIRDSKKAAVTVVPPPRPRAPRQATPPRKLPARKRAR